MLSLSIVTMMVLGRRVQFEPDVPLHNADTSSWVKGTRVRPNHNLDLTVQMRVNKKGLDELERVFWEVSDPRHENYGKHQTPEQIGQILGMPEERITNVRNFFVDHGFSKIDLAPHKDVFTVGASASVIEEALQTELYYFSHLEYPKVHIVRSATGYSLPEDIANDVIIVGELLQFPRMKKKSLTNVAAGEGSWPNDCEGKPVCKNHVTPGVLTTRYKLSNTTKNAKNSMAVAEFQGQYFKHKDLESFSTECHRNVQVDVVIGGNVEIGGVEAELDIEYIRSVAPEVSLTVIYSGQYSLLNWCNKIIANSTSPYVHSVSYGNDEAQQTGDAYMFSCNTAFQKAGAQGLSILFASGDQGVCGREGCSKINERFHPDFPAGSPYITAVGGTDFAGSDIGEETAWAMSGGGFSDTFDIPEFQKAAVAGYKSDSSAKLPPQSMWNNTGRGYPDISALGGQKNPYCIAAKGNWLGVAGTSASSPVAAGVFAKLNNIRLNAGKPVMGFLNPFIYQNPSGFQDVTSGCNNEGKQYGFTAIKGWDPATGHGTPNFEALSKLV